MLNLYFHYIFLLLLNHEVVHYLLLLKADSGLLQMTKKMPFLSILHRFKAGFYRFCKIAIF